MPKRPLRPCSYPGCHALVSTGSRCEIHANSDDALRGSSTKRGYGYKWRKVRERFLHDNPWCCDPFGDHHGQQIIATQVDHIIPRAIGGLDGVDNLESLCAHCHSKKTAKEDGGFGNER